MKTRLFLSYALRQLLCCLFQTITIVYGYAFALVGKDDVNNFFKEVNKGCQKQALAYQTDSNVTCIFTGPALPEQAGQTAIVEDLLANQTLDGLAISVIDIAEGTRLIKKALKMNIPTITFDSDAPNSGRLAYVGTNNKVFGFELAMSLLQLKPEGKHYAILGDASANIKVRMKAVRETLTLDGSWTEATMSPIDSRHDGDSAHELMKDAIKEDPDIEAIVSVYFPDEEQYVDAWIRTVELPEFDNIITINEVNPLSRGNLLREGYMDAAVGQQPYVMGKKVVDTLLEIVRAKEANESTEFSNNLTTYTSLVTLSQITTEIQDVVIDHHYFGELKIMGYTLYSISMLTSLFLIVVTARFRKIRVIRSSQPMFLFMILIGVMIFSSTIIPLSFDDEKHSPELCSRMCRAVPWLFFIGFTTIFSALYAKTRRINKIMTAGHNLQRVIIKEKDVMKPFVVIVLANAIVMTCWIIINPPTFKRQASPGNDYFNRTYKSYYGGCMYGGGHTPYMITLMIINMGVLVIALIEAYRARNIQTEFAESTYIAVIMASLLQAAIVAIPLLLLTEDPQLRYTLAVLFIFIVGMVVLLVLFLPKLLALRQHFRDQIVTSKNGANSNAAHVRNGHRYTMIANRMSDYN